MVSGLDKISEAVSQECVPLAKVIAEAKKALDRYQGSLAKNGDPLLSLSLAEFQFKTTTQEIYGARPSFVIFKVGVSREKDVVNDVTFTYAPKASTEKELAFAATAFEDELFRTLQSAAAAVKENRTALGLPLKQFTVVVQFGVKWDGNWSADIPIHLVTLGISGDVNRNAVQSVKLSFVP